MAKHFGPALARTDLIAGVRAHALRNYDKQGWDFLVECWSDEEIDACMGKRTKSVLGAIQTISMYGGLSLLDEQRRSVMNEADDGDEEFNEPDRDEPEDDTPSLDNSFHEHEMDVG